MKVEAYKSEFTMQLFEDEKEYKLHLEAHKEHMVLEQERKELFAKIEKMKNMPRLTAISIEDFRQKCMNVINELNELNGSGSNKLLVFDFADVRLKDIRYRCFSPIEVAQNCDLPNSYKAWTGEVTIVLLNGNDSFLDNNAIQTHLRNFPAINIGTGGYRGEEHNDTKGYVLKYDFKIFLENLPLIKQQYERLIELKERKEEWRSDINTLCDAKNKANETILFYEKVYADYNVEMELLKIKMSSMSDSISNIKKENNESVLLSKPFKEDEELKLLLKQFHT